MKLKSEAQAFLERVEMLDAIIRNKLIERQQWRDIALGITAGEQSADRVQSSGSLSKMADAIDKCIDMEAEIDAIVDKLIETKREVVHTLEQLDNPTEYNLLHMRYIQFMTLQEIADYYRREYGWCTTCHGRALKSVQAILDQK